MLTRWLPSNWRLETDRLSASTFFGVYCVLLIGIPPRLVLRPLGAVGSPATLWGLFGLMWWACASLGGRNPRHGWTPVRIGLFMFTCTVLVSYMYAMSTGWYVPGGIRQATDDIYDLVPSSGEQIRVAMVTAADRGLLALGSWLGVALMVSDGVRNRRDLDRMIGWLTGLTAVLAAVGIVQYFTGLNIASFYRIPGLTAQSEFGGIGSRSVLRRVQAMANHPIEFGVVVAAVFPLALHQHLVARTRWSLFGFGAIGFAGLLSVSRSAILVLGVGAIVLFSGWPAAWRRRSLALLPFLVVAARIAAPGVLGTIRSGFLNAGTDPSVQGRTDDYAIVFRIVDDSPWFGRGLFTFVPRYYRILDNQILMLLLEIGAVGLVVFALLIVLVLWSALGARRRTVAPLSRNGALSIAASFSGLMVSFLAYDALGFPMSAGLVFALVGLAGAAWNVAHDSSSVDQNGDATSSSDAEHDAAQDTAEHTGDGQDDRPLPVSNVRPA